jgi:hypothetical protein
MPPLSDHTQPYRSTLTGPTGRPRDTNFDWIVMATHGRSGIKRPKRSGL